MSRHFGRWTLPAVLILAMTAAACWCCGLWTPPASAQQAPAAGDNPKSARSAKPASQAGAAAAQASPTGSASGATGQKSQSSATSSTRTSTTTSGPASSAAGKAPSRPPGSPGNPSSSGTSTPPPDMGNIDQILEGDEEVLAGNSFTYDPGNRRDPFKSLLIAADRPEFRGPRPEGIPGLLIDEIDLKGVFRTARGYVAQVTAANQKKSYLLKEGDQLYDGDVVSIGKNEVVFKQIVQDPSALKPFREVVKSLNPQ
jgi:hypothetical protein